MKCVTRPRSLCAGYQLKLRSYEMSDNIEVVTQTARSHEVTYNGKNLSAAKAKQLDLATLDSNRAVRLSPFVTSCYELCPGWLRLRGGVTLFRSLAEIVQESRRGTESVLLYICL